MIMLLSGNELWHVEMLAGVAREASFKAAIHPVETISRCLPLTHFRPIWNYLLCLWVSSLWPGDWAVLPAAPTSQTQKSTRTASTCMVHIPQRSDLSCHSESTPLRGLEHSTFLRHSLPQHRSWWERGETEQQQQQQQQLHRAILRPEWKTSYGA